jgi:hypothetical protein
MRLARPVAMLFPVGERNTEHEASELSFLDAYITLSKATARKRETP